MIFQYFTIAAGLPSVDDLAQYASQFETTRIYDRNENLIYEILDPNAGRRTYTELEDISPFLIAATIATEDKDFYINGALDYQWDRKLSTGVGLQYSTKDTDAVPDRGYDEFRVFAGIAYKLGHR